MASWFETRGAAALLTMRVWLHASCDDLILGSRLLQELKRAI
jgi:hypothetical protein